jgi:hypothetical protein
MMSDKNSCATVFRRFYNVLCPLKGIGNGFFYQNVYRPLCADLSDRRVVSV